MADYICLSMCRSLILLPYMGLSYAQLTETILSVYFDDLDRNALRQGIDHAFAKFDTPRVAPLTRYGSLWLLELTHGPTAAFKDVALTLLPHLMSCSKQVLGHTTSTHILTATSGDTGSAALAGFAGIEGFSIDVFYPLHGISTIQQRQMTTVTAPNVRVAAINGNFDEAQRTVKAIFAEADRYPFHLSSANSINIGRLLPQVVYYVSAYLDLVREGDLNIGQPMDVAVPSGNFGNILAAYLAKLSGVPIGRLICASNDNHVLTDFINSGHYDRNRPFTVTSSPSMDILVSSNLERLLALMAPPDQITLWMNQLDQAGHYTIDPLTLQKIQATFIGEWVTEREVNQTIAKFHRDHQRLIDPHTAVAVTAALRHRTDSPLVIAETASPFKFPSTVLQALHHPVDASDLINLHRLEALGHQRCPPALLACLSAPIRHSRVLEPAQCPDYLLGKELS
jgi:threonine synthase